MPLYKSSRSRGHVHENVRRPPGLPPSAVTSPVPSAVTSPIPSAINTPLPSTINSPIPSPPLRTRNLYTEALEGPARVLGDALLHATKCVERTIILAFHQNDPPPRLLSWSHRSSRTDVGSTTSDDAKAVKGWTTSQLAALHEAESRLVAARDSAQEAIQEVFNDTMAERNYDITTRLPQEARNCSLAMIALLQVCFSLLHWSELMPNLLQMAHEIRLALQIAQRFAHKYDSSSPRLWFPHVSLAWLGVPPGSFISDDPNALLNSASQENIPDMNTDFGEGEFKQGLQEQVYRVDVRKSAAKTAILNLSKTKSNAPDGDTKHSWLRGFSKSFWTSRKALKLRIRAWRFMQATKNSSHLRHALKAAVGVAILTFPAFLPVDSAGASLEVCAGGSSS